MRISENPKYLENKKKWLGRLRGKNISSLVNFQIDKDLVYHHNFILFAKSRSKKNSFQRYANKSVSKRGKIRFFNCWFHLQIDNVKHTFFFRRLLLWAIVGNSCSLVKNYSRFIAVSCFRSKLNHRYLTGSYPARIYLLKVNNRNTRTKCELRQWRRSGVFIVNFEHISNLVLVSLLLTLNM